MIVSVEGKCREAHFNAPHFFLQGKGQRREDLHLAECHQGCPGVALRNESDFPLFTGMASGCTQVTFLLVSTEVRSNPDSLASRPSSLCHPRG